MRFDILTIFPFLLNSPLQEGIIRRALEDRKIAVHVHNLRDFTNDKHATTDDRPFGGGEGMVMKPEPIAAALQHIDQQHPGGRRILLSPQGRPYSQAIAEEFAEQGHLIFICGRYEGVDERIRQLYVDDEISIGDYVLTGGELAAMVLVDSVTRLLPDVLGCADSAAFDTFSRGLLKNSQFTRPRVFENFEVPQVLLTGDHEAIAEWRFINSVRLTLDRRPDLIAGVRFNKKELEILEENGLLTAVKKYNAGVELSHERH